MTAIDKVQYLQIGVQGENVAMNIEFDMTAWADQYPNATFSILFKPYNETEVSPQTSTYDSETKVLTWTVGAGATAVVGVGYTEIRAQDGQGLVKKSRVIPTAVENSVSGVEVNPPAAYADWVTNVLNAGAAVVALAHGAEISFSIDDDGHLVYSYTDEDEETVTVDLGPIDAYAMAVAGGYEGTKAEFEQYVADILSAKDNAAASAADAAASAEEARQYTVAEIDDWLEANITEPEYPLDRTLSLSSAAAPADMVGDLKSAIKAYTGNENIEYTLQNGYYPTSTVGSVVDFNTPTLSNNFESVIIECSAGDKFTVNGIGGSTGRLWAFLDSDKKVKRRETNNYEITNKVITAESGEVWLVINNNKTTLPNAVSYYGVILLSRVAELEENSANRETVEFLQTAFYDFQSDKLPIMLVKDTYVTTSGTIEPYVGWDSTEYIPVIGYKKITVKSSVQSGYNVFLTSAKAKTGNNFTVTTDYTDINVPNDAAYVLMSNTAAGMRDLEASFTRYPEMTGKHPANQSALSEFTEMGVYNIEKANLSIYTDKPSDADDAVATLINYSGAYASGNYTIQRLYQLSGKAWERLIYSPTGEVSKDWSRIDLLSDTSNYLKGKKLVTAGDSYTQAYWDGDYAEYNGKNYGYYIAQRNGMTFVNAGISGSTMAVPPGGAGNKNPFVIDRYTAVPADTDYLTIWFGINDAANCDLGSITDGDDGTPVNNTIYGAWNMVLKYYLTNRPWMKVLIIVPSMPNSESANNVRNAIRAVAKKWGYPYLDWQMDYSIPAFFDKREGMSNEAVSLRRAAFGYNGPNEGHPNPQWYEYESKIIEAKLRSI